MISRLVHKLLLSKLSTAPAVSLLGPRQCGKTTLARSLPGNYYDLELPAVQTRVDVVWDELMTSSELIIFDEAQSAPLFFPRMRSAIDADRKRHGRFLLLGSISPVLMRRVAESLAGRLALVELSPLLALELEKSHLADLWLKGGFPSGGVLGEAVFPSWQRDYLRLMAERDLPNWGLPATPRVTERLLKMTAALNAQPLNYYQLGQSLGISHATVRNYLDFLAGAYLLRILPPYHKKISKRLHKAPRLYWRDSGLLHSLLGIRSYEQLLEHPSVGWSWEGFVIEQILSTLESLGIAADSSYFRTSDGYEMDLILEFGSEKWGVEIKLTSSPSQEDLRRLRKTAQLIDCDRMFLISNTSDPVLCGDVGSVDLHTFLQEVSRLPTDPHPERPEFCSFA